MAETQETDKEITGSQPQGQAASLGDMLQTARAAKAFSLQDVSDNLRYSVKQIDALEKGAFDLLPDPMITRGFIRNYARLLEIDAEPLLASYRQSVASESDNLIAMRPTMRPVQLTEESQPWLKYILASILVVLLLLAWLFYVDYMPKSTNDAADQTSAPEVIEESSSSAAEPLPEIALPAAQRLAEVDAATADSSFALNLPAQPATNVADVKPADVMSQRDFKPLALPVNQLSQSPAIAAGAKPADKTVNMAFTAQTWVRVTDKSGKVVFEKILHNGDQQTINSALPLNLVIGNASGTKLNFGGKDIDLAPNTKDNVARITLE
jgi:cytoskeleton protein RodZ